MLCRLLHPTHVRISVSDVCLMAGSREIGKTNTMNEGRHSNDPIGQHNVAARFAYGRAMNMTPEVK
jgi:hypothetical protein